MENLKSKLMPVVIGALIAFLLLGAVYLYLNRTPPTAAPDAVAVPAAVAPQVAIIPTVRITPKQPIKVYTSPAKTRLQLPAEIVADENKSVIASSRIRADDRPQTVTTVLDTATGESKTYVKQEPLPWLAFDTRGEAGIYAGLKNGQPTARLQLRQGVLQVKAVHIGGIASLDQPLSGPVRADYFVGVGVWAQW